MELVQLKMLGLYLGYIYPELIIQITLLILLCACSVMSATPWTVAHQVPLSMEVFRQEWHSRVPLPTPEDLPNPGIKLWSLVSPAFSGGFFTAVHLGKHMNSLLAACLLVEKISIKIKGDLLFMEEGRISNINFLMSIH